MQERIKPQRIPVKVYRTADLVTVAAPMPGLQPEDIVVEITLDGRLALSGELRGVLKGVKDLLIDEWSVGAYQRMLDLPAPVDGQTANVTYGNGVLVVALPVAAATRPARLTLEATATDHGAYFGHAGRAVELPLEDLADEAESL
jgi:HSP20 family protein